MATVEHGPFGFEQRLATGLAPIRLREAYDMR